MLSHAAGSVSSISCRWEGRNGSSDLSVLEVSELITLVPIYPRRALGPALRGKCHYIMGRQRRLSELHRVRVCRQVYKNLVGGPNLRPISPCTGATFILRYLLTYESWRATAPTHRLLTTCNNWAHMLLLAQHFQKLIVTIGAWERALLTDRLYFAGIFVIIGCIVLFKFCNNYNHFHPYESLWPPHTWGNWDQV